MNKKSVLHKPKSPNYFSFKNPFLVFAVFLLIGLAINHFVYKPNAALIQDKEKQLSYAQTPSTQIPVGTIIYWYKSTPPSGFIECNGQSTSAYPALAAVIGANVPDLRDQFIRALDSRTRTVGSFQTDEIKAHNHVYGDNAVNAAWGSSSMVADHGNHASRVWSANPYTSTTGGTETRPKNVALMAIIKY